jgi:hypothetical protein
MAPEQATGGPVTPATDVYALGVTLYEMLSGTLPFPRGDSALAVLYQRVHTSPTPLPDVAPNVPPRLAELVMWALMTDPEHRPQSAHTFAMALAERATEVFGPGWLAGTGLRASLGGQIAALTERTAAVPAASVPRDVVRPDRVTRAAPVASVDPSRLVPVAENAEDSRTEHLRELRLLLGRATTTEAVRLASEIERAESTTHELRELALLRRLRAGEIMLPPAEMAEVERLVGVEGTSAPARLGLGPDASVDEVRAAAEAAVERWRRRAEHPLTSRSVATLATDVIRTCEGLLADRPDDARR